MLGRQAKPRSDQQRAEFVAVQRGRMRLVIYPRTANVRGGSVIEEFFLNRVLIEPGDGG